MIDVGCPPVIRGQHENDMARNKTSNGRSGKSLKHIQHGEWMLKTPAYRSLHPYARSLLIEFYRKYNGQNNGYVSMSIREAQDLILVGRKAVERGLAELKDRGFIKVQTMGLFINGMATEYILSEFSLNDQLPSKDFMKWKAKTEVVAP